MAPWFVASGCRIDDDGDWANLGPGIYHPLDAILPYAERVATLAKLCAKCQQPEGCHGNWCGPPVHDGINWHTVAVLLDAMQDLGIGLDVVHEWRPEGCLYHSCAVRDGEECALGKMPHQRHECPYWGTAP